MVTSGLKSAWLLIDKMASRSEEPLPGIVLSAALVTVMSAGARRASNSSNRGWRLLPRVAARRVRMALPFHVAGPSSNLEIDDRPSRRSEGPAPVVSDCSRVSQGSSLSQLSQTGHFVAKPGGPTALATDTGGEPGTLVPGSPPATFVPRGPTASAE